MILVQRVGYALASPQITSAAMQAKVRAAHAAVLELVLSERGSFSLRAIRSSLLCLLGASGVLKTSTDVGKPTPFGWLLGRWLTAEITFENGIDAC